MKKIAALLLFCVITAAVNAEDINFTILGDIHYARDEYTKRVGTIAYYIENTNKYYDSKMSVISSELKKKRSGCIVQLGDFVEGMALKDASAAENIFVNHLSYIKTKFDGIPYLVVLGNHDKDSFKPVLYDVYAKKYLTEWNYQQVNKIAGAADLDVEKNRAYFAFILNKLQFVFIDSIDPDWTPKISDEQQNWITKRLKLGRVRNVKTLLFTHAPVIPLNLYGHLFMASPEKNRAFFFSILKAGINTVFCAHSHYYYNLTYFDMNGNVLKQICAPYIFMSKTEKVSVLNYDESLLPPKNQKVMDNDTRESLRRQIEGYSKNVKSCMFSETAGYINVSISEMKMKVDFMAFSGNLLHSTNMDLR